MGKRKRRENPRSSSGKRNRPHVPGDVWWDILILLPASSLAPVRAVCKAWRTVIDDPIFHRAHHEKRQNNTMLIRTRTSSTAPPFTLHYSVDLDALFPATASKRSPPPPARPHLRRFPVATCHGLMFEGFEIWNPLFADRVKLPVDDFSFLPDPHDNKLARGLGYDHVTDDYKAVVIDCGPRHQSRHDQLAAFRTFVYSLRSDSWRRVGDCPCDLEERPGIFLNGALHWMSCDDYYYDDDVDGDEIIALDLQTEKYRKLQMPPFGKVRRRKGRQLDELDRCLVVTDFGKDGDCSFYFDAWVLERGGGEWIKLFSVWHSSYRQIDSGMRPVGYIMKNKRHILMEEGGRFYLVDAEIGKLKRVCFSGLDVDYLYAQPFQETLFRPKDICGGQQRNKMERKSKSKTRMVEKYDTDFCVCISDF